MTRITALMATYMPPPAAEYERAKSAASANTNIEAVYNKIIPMDAIVLVAKVFMDMLIAPVSRLEQRKTIKECVLINFKDRSIVEQLSLLTPARCTHHRRIVLIPAIRVTNKARDMAT